jgi:secondary thiamine-phosphate synthase enzyme
LVETKRHQIATRGQGDVQDLTGLVARVLDGSSLKKGLVTIAVVGSTAGITTIEFEPGAVADLNRVWEQLAPRDGEYQHHLQWGDDNGSSHVRAAMLGPSISIPFDDGRLCVGTWQQIVLIEFDTRGRNREVVVQLIGESE